MCLHREPSSNMAPQNVSLVLHFLHTKNNHNSNAITDQCSSLAKFRLLVGELPGLYRASTSNTSLLTGLSSSEPLLVNTVTDRTCPWSSGWVSITLAMGHLFLGDWFSFSRTTSLILKFLCGRIHLFLACNCCRYSLHHLDQNSRARCCVRLHLFLHYRSSLLNSPGGGSTSLVFPVSSILGDNGGAESGSLRVSTVCCWSCIQLRKGRFSMILRPDDYRVLWWDHSWRFWWTWSVSPRHLQSC